MRVHARFERRVRDLPIQGERVLFRLACSKFVCGKARCGQRIFCERFGAALPAFARMTAITACMRKLLTILNAITTTGRSWEPRPIHA